MSTLEDTDLLLVNRGGTNYQLAAVDLVLKSGEIGSPVEVLTPPDGSGVGGANTFTPQTGEILDITRILDYGDTQAAASGTSGGNTSGLAYGNGTYVLLVDDGRAPLYSTDEARSWTKSPAWPGGSGWTALTWNGNVFCAVGDNAASRIMTSPDGITWTAINSPPACKFKDVDSDLSTGKIVAVGNDNIGGQGIWYSTNDGQSWNVASINVNSASSQDKNYGWVKYGNGRWVALNMTRRDVSPAYSSNGTSWNQPYVRLAADNSNWDGIAYDDDAKLFTIYWMNNSQLIMWSSPNGQTWTNYSQSNMQSYDIRNSQVAYGNGLYVIIPTNDAFRYFYTTVSQGFDNWSTEYYYTNNSTNLTLHHAFYVNNRWFTYGVSFFKNEPQNSFGSIFPRVNYDKRNTQYNHDRLTFADDSIYDVADNSLKEDYTIEGLFPYGTTVRNPVEDRLVNAEVASGNQLTVTNGGNWSVGNPVERYIAITEYGPSPTSIVFTSMNAGTSEYNGTDATLAYRKWTVDTRASDSDPWTNVTIADDYDPVASQDGATPWSSKPSLDADTQYRVKVEYSSDNARSVESDYNYFTTGPS